MQIYLYTHYKNVDQFNKGKMILCRTVPANPHEIQVQFNVRDIYIDSNQSGIYIYKKTVKNRFERLVNKIKRGK